MKCNFLIDTPTNSFYSEDNYSKDFLAITRTQSFKIVGRIRFLYSCMARISVLTIEDMTLLLSSCYKVVQ